MKSGIYIHIPFCQSRCVYCGFYSTTHTNLQQRYTDALLHEMELRRDTMFNTVHGNGLCTPDTIYIGGGTPSTLSLDQIERILSKVRKEYPGKPTEITMEMNPDDITPQLIRGVKAVGVNRISMGIQTFNDERLHFLRRRHTAKQAMEAVETVRDCGIENVSIDLMFGFPNESIDEWTTDIDTAVALAPNHISAYCLMYEEGTPLYRMLADGKVKQVDEDTYIAMYTRLIDTLASNGYEHYEISNFARKGYRSIHNSSYWHDIPYLGFGASAHSYLGNKRSWNVSDINAYINAIEHDEFPSESEIIDDDTHYNDLVTTAMRTREGLNLDSIPEKYKKYAVANASESISNGLLELSENCLRLTRKGVFVSDMVMSDLIMV